MVSNCRAFVKSLLKLPNHPVTLLWKSRATELKIEIFQ